jgi:hypothetical protein
VRQPRQPRPPREPREPRPDPAAVPPPGFSIPISGFSFGRAPGSGPQPSRRYGAYAPAAAMPGAAQGPPAAPPAATAAESYEPPAGPAIAATLGNEWQARTTDRQGFQYRQPRTAPPQGETLLVHAWLHVLTALRIPPQACTIWLRCVDQPNYELYIPGEAVCGEHPDRALYEYVSLNRRRRDVAERFVGRIRGPTRDGSPYECGGGELYLPPAPPSAAAPAWSTPGAAQPPWSSPYGPPSPWGPPPPWYPPAGGAMGMPPWWGPSQAPLSALLAAAHAPPVPAAVQSDPASLAWAKAMQENQAAMFKAFVEMAGRPPPTPAALPPQTDGFEQAVRIIDLVAKLKPEAASTSPSVSVIHVDDDTTLVTDKNGDINPGATAWANMKGVKGLVSALRPSRPNGAGQTNGGPGPARRVGPGGNAAASPKANGAS